ncbi:gamma-glutamyltransferase [Wenzhouxiangella sp. AB-CW3]|uniref:gamma-glutamyltransferase n=1 Tax=Wenzhouxiangella sp. AB-CW3 TaxID=2771012 RepID=UPI00168AF952|nr:gamma-glutamyltransferase [Wenzhouxiangella sp. AB-CW3]QOC22804.1 gamma-glutamyltransferase [Wenzhouxiangella sp. AB-CW3]
MKPGRSRRAGWRVASGHEETTQAAVAILRAGGNAADAAVSAALAAAVAEPLLCSIGGGLHGLVHCRGRAPLALDAFTQTPRRRRRDALDFYPILGNFGPDVQEFHVGMASIATPGMLAGLSALHERHGRVPLSTLVEPAMELARQGVALNAIQHYTVRILEPIVRASDDCARLFGLNDRHDALPTEGTLIRNRPLADFLDAMGREGVVLFYQGDTARQLASDSADNGGHLGLEDLACYRPRWRRPLSWTYRDARIWSTPPPAFGGMMLALASHGLEQHLPGGQAFGNAPHLKALLQSLEQTEQWRRKLEQPELFNSDRALRKAFLALMQAGPQARRGTTQISIDDGHELGISLTLSNGEGSGYVLPGTGILLNNMLGEEDLNRNGFHRWPTNRRLASMMAPMMLRRGQSRWLLGSGGSNRIRTALAQVICNLVDFDLPLDAAIAAPRMHLENGQLAIELEEGAWPDGVTEWLDEHQPHARRWPERNMYFGGVHAVGPDAAAADPRRLGSATSSS